ncbi:hypothetical protein OUZ56_000708 [Daphnia magna]|uniref:Uncharacterized protein n=1 Tax=Daphnia magna TaxID=35525 RepID=A0ABR0A0H5_9CRUS|nr:hypothetical protein OUZ56_000708 [Daphnia magna]
MDAKDGKLKARRDYSELHLTRISTSLANNSGGKTQQLEIVDGISPVTRIDSSLFHCKTNAVQRENSKKPTNEGGMEKVGTRMPLSQKLLMNSYGTLIRGKELNISRMTFQDKERQSGGEFLTAQLAADTDTPKKKDGVLLYGETCRMLKILDVSKPLYTDNSSAGEAYAKQTGE